MAPAPCFFVNNLGDSGHEDAMYRSPAGHTFVFIEHNHRRPHRLIGAADVLGQGASSGNRAGPFFVSPRHIGPRCIRSDAVMIEARRNP